MDGRLTQLALPDGRSVAFTYLSGLLRTVTDARGGVTTYDYDAGSRLSAITLPGETVPIVTNVYGSDGRVIKQIDALGKESLFAWDAATETSTMTDARGKIWKDRYQNNALVARIDPEGKTTTYRYDGDLNVSMVTDGRGNTVRTLYDAKGNLLRREAPAPFTFAEEFTYTSKNDPATYKDGRGNHSTLEYNTAGNLIKATLPATDAAPGGTIWEFGRHADGTGRLVSLEDPRGKITEVHYGDPANPGSVTKTISPLGNKPAYTYDASGRLTGVIDPRGNAPSGNPNDYRWALTYDEADNLRTRTDPLGNVVEWTYDPVGNLDTFRDTVGGLTRITDYVYTDRNELEKVIAPDATIVTSYGYDAAGNLTSRTDANGHVTTYGYDTVNRLDSVASPIGQTWTYDYDSAGNLIQVVDANGNETPGAGDGKTDLSYDALNRLAEIDYSDSTSDVTFEYDANGNRTEMDDGTAETYVYDAVNQLASVTRASETFSYAYDAAGNATRRTYPSGHGVIDYAYDDDGRPDTVTIGTRVVADHTFDPASNLFASTLSNGVSETRTYDRAGRITRVRATNGPTVITDSQYTLDAVGNPTRIDTPTGFTNYLYDPLDRVIKACFEGSCTSPLIDSIAYTYDKVGNRKTEQRTTSTTTYAYNDADQLTSRTAPTGTTTFEYDDNGNQTEAGTRTLSYDLANRLKQTSDGVTTVSYTYDGVGKRLTATPGAPAAGIRTLWDPNHPLPQQALELDGGNGSLVRRYVHGSDLLEMRTSGTDYAYHHDGLGSVASFTNSSGNRQRSYSYEPFGLLRGETVHDPLAPDNRMRFTGESLDQETGFYHLRARQYDPALGRFITRDPSAGIMGHPSSQHGYVYAWDNPMRWVDPSGLSPLLTPPDSAPSQQPSVSRITGVGRPPPSSFECRLISTIGTVSSLSGVAGFFVRINPLVNASLFVFGGISILAGFQTGCL